jgi:hypothetical protein
VTAAEVLRRGVPRILLSSLGPLAGFWAGSRLGGLYAGIAFATAVSLAVYWWERRRGRPGLLARLSLAVIVLQVLLGGLGESAFLYFLPRIGVDVAEGLAHYASCLTRRPLAAVFARELVTVPHAVLQRPPARRLFVRITLVWGTYFTGRGLLTLVVLVSAGADAYLLVRALVDAPLVIPLLAASLTVALRRLPRLASGSAVS